jgi:hypothetical protein
MSAIGPRFRELGAQRMSSTSDASAEDEARGAPNELHSEEEGVEAADGALDVDMDAEKMRRTRGRASATCTTVACGNADCSF